MPQRSTKTNLRVYISESVPEKIDFDYHSTIIMGNKSSAHHSHLNFPPTPGPNLGQEVRVCPIKPHYDFVHHHRHHSPKLPVIGNPAHKTHHGFFSDHQKRRHHHGCW
uniref:Uncharacterized protein n=1 Tax=Plectus sambesii TaxID=2011161 RepID=A0A914V8T3_9BILA